MNRRKLLAKVHVLKKQQGLDDETYRDAIQGLFGVRSSADLSDDQLVKLIDHLSGRHRGRPKNMDHPERGAMLRKISALLADGQRPWAYAHAIAFRMYGVQRVDWLPLTKLRSVIAALEYDKRRRSGEAK